MVDSLRVNDLTVLRIELVKESESCSVLRCRRAYGSVTWQKRTRDAAHFALHDLTHYAVESTLGYTEGFFGLLAAGWELDDTTGKGARGALPAAALEVEKLVGLFDSERRSGVVWSAEEFNGFAPRPLTDAEIQKVRLVRGELFRKWFDLRAGERLELLGAFRA